MRRTFLNKKIPIMKTLQTLKVITAKYGSRCAETKKSIKAGDIILYNPSTKRTWCAESKKYGAYIGRK
jgi:hypothetical protein